jgi:ABC-type glycerol-3-phosphate transport system substrate-binding protein
MTRKSERAFAAAASGGAGISRRSLIRVGAAALAAPSVLRLVSRSAQAASPATIVAWSCAGQRWEFPQKGVYPLFQKKFPDIQVQFTADPIADMAPKAAIAMSSKSDRYDSILMDYGYVPQFVEQKSIEPIQSYIDKDAAYKADILADIPENVLDLYRDKPAARGGVLYGLPPDGNTQLQYYRADVFEKAGIKAPAETWEDAIEIAKELSEGGRKNVVGTTLKRGNWSASVFVTLLRSYGGEFFDKMEKGGWKPMLDSEQGHKAFDVLLRLLKYCDPTTLNAADDEANTAMLNGTWLYSPVEWGGSSMNDPKFTKYSDLWKATMVPKGTGEGARHAPHMGGHGMIIPAFSHHKDQAWEWIKFCCSGDAQDPAIGEAWVNNTGQPARLSLLKKYANIRPYFTALMDSLPVAHPFLLIPEGAALYELVGTEVTAVATGAKAPEQSLKDMQAQVVRLMTKNGYYN